MISLRHGIIYDMTVGFISNTYKLLTSCKTVS